MQTSNEIAIAAQRAGQRNYEAFILAATAKDFMPPGPVTPWSSMPQALRECWIKAAQAARVG